MLRSENSWDLKIRPTMRRESEFPPTEELMPLPKYYKDYVD